MSVTKTPDAALVDDPNMSDVDRFIAENPEPIQDPPEKPLVRATATEPEPKAEPVAETPPTDAQGEPEPQAPSEEPTPAPAATAEPKPAEEPKPVAEVKPPTEEPKPTVEAPKEPVAAAEPKPVVYDPNEKFGLAPGVDWTREQVITRLQEYQALLPQVEEGKKYAELFQFPSYEKAAEQWSPVLKILREQPEKTQFFDAVLKADAAKVAYLADSAAFWDQKVAAGEITPPTVVEKPAPVDVSKDPQVAEALAYIAREKAKAGSARGQREWTDAFNAYPFLRTDNAAREVLMSLANALYNEDRAKGIDDLECRGIAAAVEANKALYDARMVVLSQQEKGAAAVPAASTTPTQPEPILGSTGPAPAARQPRAKIYKGDPEDAVAAFVKDYPS